MSDWILTGGAIVNGNTLTFVPSSKASLPEIVFRSGVNYELKLNLTGAFSPGAVIKVTMGDTVIGINSLGVKEYNQLGSGGVGFKIETIIGSYTGDIAGILLNNLNPVLVQADTTPNNAGTLNDAIIAQTGGPTIALGLATWYEKTPDEALSDAEYRWLLSQPGVLTPGTLNDMWFQFLVSEGHSGALNDMQLLYWTGVGP